MKATERLKRQLEGTRRVAAKAGRQRERFLNARVKELLEGDNDFTRISEELAAERRRRHNARLALAKKRPKLDRFYQESLDLQREIEQAQQVDLDANVHVAQLARDVAELDHRLRSEAETEYREALFGGTVPAPATPQHVELESEEAAA